MNLLPRSHEEFSQKDYWDNFFKKRGNKAFEWYGEYPELCDHLHKYIKTKDDVLIVGCGNSTLGNDLYDIGYKNITSIDISQVAIRQMNNLNTKQRPEMKFIQMDALDMSFEDATYSVILDKGTLDALMPNDDLVTIATIEKYFNEIMRNLKLGGRFVCVSLLQEHILKILVGYFPKNNCMFRIARCYEAETAAGDNAMPVFMVICTKFKTLTMKVLELNLSGGDKMQRIQDENDLIGKVLAVQHSAFICSGLKRSTIADDNDVSFDLFQSGNDLPRYTVYIVDVPHDRKNMVYSAFIVPQGRESEWLFSTKEGRKQLATMSKCNRLTVVTLHRGQNYENLDSVKLELGDVVQNLAPSNIGNDKILFLSLGSDVGNRTVCFEGKSNFSGDYVVEDVDIDGSKYRRLYYLSTRLVIQSEAKLKTVKSRSGKPKLVVDTTYLTCEHHIPMCRAVQMAVALIDKPTIAIIGLGGGSLCSFLRKFIPKLRIDAVDIDADMQNVATEWFGMIVEDLLKVHIMDGLNFLKNAANAKEKFDAILFDVDSKDTTIGMSCPPKEFLTNNALLDVLKSLKPEGLFILNAVVRDRKLRPGIIKSLGVHFKTIAAYKLENDLNEIFISSTVETTSVKSEFKKATLDINKFFSKCNNKDLLIDESDNALIMLNEIK